MTTPLMAGLSLGGTALGSIFGGLGAYEKGVGEQNLFNYQSRVAQINAGIAGEQATAETLAGDIRAQQSGIRTGQRIGETRAGMAAGNLDIGTGSARQVVSSEAEVGQFEQNTIRNDAARRAYASRVSQFGDIAQGQVDIAAGQGARTAAGFNVASSILGGATQVSDKWTKFGQAGLTPPPFVSDNAIY